MHAYMPLSLKFSPDIFEWLLARVSEEKMDVPTHPERFSPRQIACHLAFWEPVARWRMQRALEEDGAAVEGWDEDGHCIEANYDGQDLEEMLAHFRAERLETKAWLDALPREQWSRSVVHPERGVMTITDMANMLPAHDIYHIQQLMEVIS